MSDLDISALFAGLDTALAPETTSITANAYASLLGDLGPIIGDGEDDDDADAPERIRAKRGTGVSGTERKRASRGRAKQRMIDNIAVLDFETDPFDNIKKEAIFPFLAVLYSDNFEPVIIWDNENEAFVSKVIAAIEALPEAYTIYAHNGGKFDYMFLLSKLKGEVMFKGRGIMTAQIGKHELRDSFHIIPDRLANFKKDHIDYGNMKRLKRERYKQEIIKYCINDCKYLLDIVKGFATRFGMKLSIGQAAMADIRKHYKFERLTEMQDEFFRQFFFGGRVECFVGTTHRKGDYKLYDVNAMYPDVMANFEHPIGNVYFKHTGKIGPQSCFIDLTCNSAGAFILKDGLETKAPHGRYRFKTTIWEYKVAKKYNLISDEEIHEVIDIPLRTNFKKFVVPHYLDRQHLKAKKNELELLGLKDTPEYDEIVKDDMFKKFLLNNGYGKFAQNPRNYKEHYITAPGEIPPPETGAWPGKLLMIEDGGYWLHSRPNPSDRFNNVATGASITGAARAKLLEAKCNAIEPIYCDTDSLICKELNGVHIHKTDLGAWDLECEISEIVVCGKKLYGYRDAKTGKTKTRAKGAGLILTEQNWKRVEEVASDRKRELLLEQLSWEEMLNQIEDAKKKTMEKLSWENMMRLHNGEQVSALAMGATLTKGGEQYYMERRISATAQRPMQG